MKLKRISALVLALAMTASVAAFAAESEADVVVDNDVIREVNHDQGDISLLAAPAGGGFGPGFGGIAIPVSTVTSKSYATTATIAINGEALNSYEYTWTTRGTWETTTVTATFAELPVVDPGYIPLRAVVQGDHGSAQWLEDDNFSRFYLDKNTVVIKVTFDDMAIYVNDELVEGATALLIAGVTFIPASVIDGLEGFEVVHTSADGVEHYEITTPNSQPMMKLAYGMMDTAGMASLQPNSMEDLILYYGAEFGFNEEMMTECVAFWDGSGMNADVLILAKLTDESKQAEIKAAFEAYQARELQRCSWGYLTPNLPKIQNAKIEFAGDWAMFLISETPDAAVEQFKTTAAGM